jgi:hypothetical protein
MSVKFEKETVRAVTGDGAKSEDLVHRVGERLTGGKTASGYLQVCIPNPLLSHRIAIDHI